MFLIFAPLLYELPMRRYIITIVLSLWLASLFGDNHTQDSTLSWGKAYFPVVETPACFRSNVGGKDFLVFVEYSDSLSIKGHYMSLEENMTDTLPFRLEAQGQNAVLYYHGGQEVFHPHVVSMDSLHTKGYVQSGVFDSTSFWFEKHKTAAFHDYGNSRYRETLFAVEKISDITYARARGFWTEMPQEVPAIDKISQIGNAIIAAPLDLHLDIFRPKDDTLKKRPMIMFIQGGAFYFGSKDDKAPSQWCQHFASQGYVAVSIDYRIGYIPTKASIGRAAYRAVQDAHAAMRFLVAHQEEYGIDTTMMFVGGTSSGAVTALNLAFLTNEMRPSYTHKGFMRSELGDIDTCGNTIKNPFRIRGIVEMWGAMPDTAMLRGRNIPILAIHGDADKVMPYDYGYPFAVADPLNTLIVDKMYGASCIVDRAMKLGYQTRLVTFSGCKHALHQDPKTKDLNDNFFVIQDVMSDFFYSIIMPEELEIVEEGTSYSLRPQPIATSWQVEGGIILNESDSHVEVQWIKNAPKRSITASSTLPYGLGFKTTKTIN